MANFLYDLGRKAFADGDIDLLVDTIKAMLVDTALYTANQATDNALDDIVAGARIGTAQTLGTKDTTAGIFDAADPVFSGLVAAPTIEAVVLYKDTGVEGTSLLIAYLDTGTGMPIPAGATQVTVVWDNGANKIFKL